jgi:hypothetical protein
VFDVSSRVLIRCITWFTLSIRVAHHIISKSGWCRGQEVW